MLKKEKALPAKVGKGKESSRVIVPALRNAIKRCASSQQEVRHGR